MDHARVGQFLEFALAALRIEEQRRSVQIVLRRADGAIQQDEYPLLCRESVGRKGVCKCDGVPPAQGGEIQDAELQLRFSVGCFARHVNGDQEPAIAKVVNILYAAQCPVRGDQPKPALDSEPEQQLVACRVSPRSPRKGEDGAPLRYGLTTRAIELHAGSFQPLGRSCLQIKQQWAVSQQYLVGIEGHCSVQALPGGGNAFRLTALG